MSSPRRRLTAAAATLALALGLAACAGQDGTADPASSPTGTTEDLAAHNAADTTFAQMMIVHHEGAIEMAGLAAERATDPEVVALAERIEAAQAPEIELMTGWLEAWGEDADAMGHDSMDHGGMAGMDMEGMNQEEAMGALDATEGEAFDQRFLELMIAHHQGAVVMAETEIEDGENPDARALAQQIIDDQTAEITEMEGLLGGS